MYLSGWSAFLLVAEGKPTYRIADMCRTQTFKVEEALRPFVEAGLLDIHCHLTERGREEVAKYRANPASYEIPRGL